MYPLDLRWQPSFLAIGKIGLHVSVLLVERVVLRIFGHAFPPNLHFEDLSLCFRDFKGTVESRETLLIGNLLCNAALIHNHAEVDARAIPVEFGVVLQCEAFNIWAPPSLGVYKAELSSHDGIIFHCLCIHVFARNAVEPMVLRLIYLSCLIPLGILCEELQSCNLWDFVLSIRFYHKIEHAGLREICGTQNPFGISRIGVRRVWSWNHLLGWRIREQNDEVFHC